jgi:hypothetical protein
MANLNSLNHEDFFLWSPCSVDRDIQTISVANNEEANRLAFAGKHLAAGNCLNAGVRLQSPE